MRLCFTSAGGGKPHHHGDGKRGVKLSSSSRRLSLISALALLTCSELLALPSRLSEIPSGNWRENVSSPFRSEADEMKVTQTVTSLWWVEQCLARLIPWDGKGLRG